MMRASRLEREGHGREAALAYAAALTQALSDDALDPAMRDAVAHARTLHARHVAELEAVLKAEVRQDLAGGSPASLSRMEAFAERAVGKRRVFHQQPLQFHYPGLPEVEFPIATTSPGWPNWRPPPRLRSPNS